MVRPIWAAGMLSCVAIGGCQIDSRALGVAEPGLLPGGEGAAGGLRVQPSSAAYGPITLAFAASARFLVENAGTSTLEAPVVSLEGDSAGAFILTENDCAAALPRGAYCAVAVAFRPRDLSGRNATLTIAGSDRRFDIPLSGSGLEPGGLLLQAAPGSQVLFGDVPLQSEPEATLQLSNPTDTSSGPIELITNHAAFQLVPARAGECASGRAELAAGQSCNFRVRFAPVLRGVTDATITARSASGSVSMGVSGRAIAPAQLIVDPARLEFGEVVVKGAAVLDFTITNIGDEPLPPITTSVSDEAASDFRVGENGCSEPLLPRGNCNVSVSFSPPATGPYTAVLSLDAGRVGSFSVELSGVGQAQGNLLMAAAENGDFGSVALGSESQRVVQIRNTSNEMSGLFTLAVNGGDFSIESPEGSECSSGMTNLAGGASCDVRVRFAPTQRGQRNATLTASSRVGGATLNLSGMGLASADIRADDTLDFGGISRGGTALLSLTVTNPGDEPLSSLSTRVSGLDATSFAVQSNGCLPGLDAQGSCLIDMVFAPIAIGSHLATLTIEGEPGTMRDVTLMGNGVALGAQPNPLVFDTPVAVGRTVSTRLTVTNRGDTGTRQVDARIVAATPTFSIRTGCTDVLAMGESCELTVDFIPTAAGIHSGTLRLTSFPGGTLEVPISATGTAGPGNLSSYLAVVAPESQYFGDVDVGTSATRSFTLRNIGDLSAGTLVGFTWGSGASFAVAPPVVAECQPGVTQLEAGSSCDFRILFQPITTGAAASYLTVSSAIGGTVMDFVSGTGTGG